MRWEFQKRSGDFFRPSKRAGLESLLLLNYHFLWVLLEKLRDFGMNEDFGMFQHCTREFGESSQGVNVVTVLGPRFSQKLQKST